MLPYGLNDSNDLLKRVADLRQLAGFQRMTLAEGKGRGNEVIHVRNGTGLSYFISVSRAFDIGLCEFYGIPVSWLSATGPVAPYFYEKNAMEWHRSFEAGMLTTCGLSYMGKPHEDQGQLLGQHGKISSTPAELLQTEGEWRDEGYEMTFRAKVRENIGHGKHLTLYRTITTALGSDVIRIRDRVVNESGSPVEHMVLYHFNFGFPLISETCTIDIPAGPKRWIDGSGPLDDVPRFEPPREQGMPSVLLHEDVASVDGQVSVALSNRVVHHGRDKRMTVTLAYRKDQCPYLTQWKHPASGVYVLGIEPGNASTEGRRLHRERGTLVMLEPGEKKEYELALSFSLKED